MNKNQSIELQFLICERLKGKMSLLQTLEVREEIVLNALDEILAHDPKGFFGGDFLLPNQKTEFIKDFLSYGVISDLLCDAFVEDIIINALKPIYIHHAQRGFVSTGKSFANAAELDLFIKKLLLFSGRDTYDRFVNLELANLGGRVNIIRSPFGPQLTITKAKVDPLSIIDLINRGSLTYEVAAQLWIYIEGLSVRPANIIIAGGPGTGKTTLLNALFSFIPPTDRNVIIEDTLELNTLLDEGCSRLESDDELSLADLVRNSLRMRPERVIIGEVRGEEARDMITAANVGKYCMGTIHALTAREAIIRLQNEPMNVPEVLINLIDVFVVLKRYHVDGKVFRVIDEISETGGMEQAKILLAPIIKYNYERHKVENVSPSTVYRDRLAKESGLTPKDIINETHLRAITLKTLGEKNIHTIKEITVFCRAYRNDPADAMAKLGLDRGQILEQLNKR